MHARRPRSAASPPALRRAVGRWQLLGLSINDVVGSSVYLLPAATFALLGAWSVWGVLLAGATVGLLVLCYAKAASHFDRQGGSYLFAREAFGPFVGFQVGWTIWLTRVTVAASLSNALADAVARFWPPAATGGGRALVIACSLLSLSAINVVGVRRAAQAAAWMAAGKLVPLLLLLLLGLPHLDWRLAASGPAPAASNPRALAEAALLLLFAYAGFENLPVAAAEYHDPKRNIPFAMLSMIVIVTLLYAAVQWVSQGLLPDLAASASPLADAAAQVGGEGLALLLTVGAAISILGTNNNTMMLGPRFLQALAADGYGPRALARIDRRFLTPAVAIWVQFAIALGLALSGSFVALALLSMVTRLIGYATTAGSVLVFQRRYGNPPGSLSLPGGALIPVLALSLTLGLLFSARLDNLLAVAVAMLVGAIIYALRRPPAEPA